MYSSLYPRFAYDEFWLKNNLETFLLRCISIVKAGKFNKLRFYPPHGYYLNEEIFKNLGFKREIASNGVKYFELILND